MLSEFSSSVFFFSLLDDDHRLFFNLHLTPSGCGAPFLGIQHIFAVLDNPVKKKKKKGGKKRRWNKRRTNNSPIGATNKQIQCKPPEAPTPRAGRGVAGTCYLSVTLLMCGDCDISSLSLSLSLSSAIHEFPSDIFTNQERKSGAVLLHIAAVRSFCFVLFLCFFLKCYTCTSCHIGLTSTRW